ncbi:anti-sigma factor antagonist [Olsenella sp. YH-ols2217]|uniref:Anti-sigma factor antagonist n=1 Tax=Kribbibacterium absianum TaxID=3044210 RepID=A0ABT6ZID1_9ACTN|nr:MULTISPECIES: anti-sigma factor antagonist [unclassified Olsenella]MDJ1121321.1 anti-sigma factor antagonist [Olsenella sp. YH-ols2216]MDJ1128811.1 anti-sigma factor antagonist [Olsenella sp. YH-ols2217]
MLIVSDCMLVPVRSDLDLTTAPVLRQHLDRIVEGGCKRVILDMDGVEYVDSTGMAMILAESRAMRNRGGLLSLANVSENTMRALSIGCLTSFIPCTQKPEAVGAVAPLKPGVTPKRRLTIKIDAGNLEASRARLRELLVMLPLTDEEVFDMTLAAGEAMGNCVLHTPEACGFLTFAVFDDRLVIEAVDNGPGFSIASDEEPVPTLEHGRGIKIMRLLCDKVDIFRKPTGNGTVARMTKLFSSRGFGPVEEESWEAKIA